MLGYDVEIIYKKWKKNVITDALSRKDEDVERLFCAISIIQPNLINKARDEWKNGKERRELIQKFLKIPVPIIFLELDKEGKISLEPGAVTKTITCQL